MCMNEDATLSLTIILRLDNWCICSVQIGSQPCVINMHEGYSVLGLCVVHNTNQEIVRQINRHTLMADKQIHISGWVSVYLSDYSLKGGKLTGSSKWQQVWLYSVSYIFLLMTTTSQGICGISIKELPLYNSTDSKTPCDNSFIHIYNAHPLSHIRYNYYYSYILVAPARARDTEKTDFVFFIQRFWYQLLTYRESHQVYYSDPEFVLSTAQVVAWWPVKYACASSCLGFCVYICTSILHNYVCDSGCERGLTVSE